MDEKKIWIVDAALCPLHRLKRKAERRHAATECLKRHTSKYINYFNFARLMAIFPLRCGFLKRQLPDLHRRIERYYTFSNLIGLKNSIW